MQEESVASRVSTLSGLDIDLESEVIGWRRRIEESTPISFQPVCVLRVSLWSDIIVDFLLQRILFYKSILQSAANRATALKNMYSNNSCVRKLLNFYEYNKENDNNE